MSDIFKRVARAPDGNVVPEFFLTLTDEFVKANSNGCGPSGAKIDLIPDSLLGVNFTEACIDHDLCYGSGKDEADKEEADILFLGNMLRAVNAKYPGDTLEERLLRKGARHLAYIYFEAVADWGKSAFFAGKD